MAFSSILNEALPKHIQNVSLDEINTETIPTDDQTLMAEIASAKKVSSDRMFARLRAHVAGQATVSADLTRHEQERMAVDAKVRAALTETSSLSADEPAPPVLRRPRAYSSTVRCLAETLDTDPSNIVWNNITASLRSGKVMEIVRDALDSSSPAEYWAGAIRSLEPVGPGCMRVGTTQIHYGEGETHHPFPHGLRLVSKADGLDASKEWMMKAENGDLERPTRCEYSGRSLIERGRVGGANYWRLTPDFHGLGIDVAREVVSAAAILSGIISGQINGTVPPLAQQLAQDGDAWCGLALATKHPIFYKVARAMTRLRDKQYWQVEGTDMRNNLQAWHRVATQRAASTKKG